MKEENEQRGNGGPAFPTTKMASIGDMAVSETVSVGITVRDYFAAKAMQSMVAYAVAVYFEKAESVVRDFDAELSTSAYEVADAMLAARAK